jgi:TRAP-type C4-dicarboxylate transport system permease small subunit
VSGGSRGLAKGAATVAEAAGVALFAAMFAMFIAGVVMRYAPTSPPAQTLCSLIFLSELTLSSTTSAK